MMLCHHSEIILANLADLSMWLLYLISLLTASQVGISQVYTRNKIKDATVEAGA